MTFPTLCIELVWMKWSTHDQVGMVYNHCWGVIGIIIALTCACDAKGCLFIDFDRRQIETSRRLGMNNTETALFVGYSRLDVVSTYAKCMNDSETRSKRDGVRRQ